MMSLLALVAITMASCVHVKIGDKEWLTGGSYDKTPTQVHEINKDIEMQDFDNLDVSGPFNVILDQGATHSVRVDGTIEQLEKITIYVKNGQLHIANSAKITGDAFKGMRVYVSTPTIRIIDKAGSGSITAPNSLITNDLSIDMAGSGEITIAQLSCSDLDIDMAGSGNITMGPIIAKNVMIDKAGSGNIDIAGLECKRLDNDIAGSGNITVNNLDAGHVESDISGSGNVVLRGYVQSHHEDVAGSGRVDISGLK